MKNPYNVRISIVFFALCVCFAIITFNLYVIQIRQHAFFTNLGEKQYAVTVTTYPPRAPILDRTGSLLAMNKDSLAAFVLPRSLSNEAQLKKFLSRNFPHALAALPSHKDTYFMYVQRRLTENQLACITNSNVADVQILTEPSRFYPCQAAAQIIGFTDIDNRGLCGIELMFNDKLAGKPSVNCLEKDARSGKCYFTKQTKQEGTSAQPVTLTIDSTLQFLVQEELQNALENLHAKESSAVIVNPQTGEILAMATVPGYDPNDTKTIDAEATKNKVITETYELGSVIKACAALAALEEGVVTLEEPIDCENVKTAYFNGRKINTVPSSVAGIIPFCQVIEKSNNIGTAKVAQRLGTKLYDHYRKLGFGTPTGIQLPGEQKGFVNHPDNWSKQSLISLSYGYEISATLLQLARVFSMIANRGYECAFTILANDPKAGIGKKLYSDRAINDLRTILENTTVRGTAQKARIANYTVLSKTGTANLLVDGTYRTDKNIYTCAGIIEKGNYKRVIITFVKEVPKKGMYASTIAAPLLERIAEKMLIHEKVL